MAKECLRLAFLHAGVGYCAGPTAPPDSHGQFGPVCRWHEFRTDVSNWLQTSGPVIAQIAAVLCRGMTVEANSLVGYALNDLVPRVDNCVLNAELGGPLSEAGLAERLAEAGILPMFGMPSRVRSLVHRLEAPALGKEPIVVERELDLAIVEFAPGSERTKDKGILKSIGLTTPYVVVKEGRYAKWGLPPHPSPYKDAGSLLTCRRCGYAELLTHGGMPHVCPSCGEATSNDPLSQCRILPLAVPSGFRTALDPRSPDTDADPDRGRQGAQSKTIAVTSMGMAAQDNTICNAHLRFVQEGRVYRINDNEGALFEGRTLAYSCHYTQGANTRSFSLPSQWIANEFAPGGPNERIALASPKTTDVLYLRPASNPHGLALNPLTTHSVGADVASRAAFYSCGFMLIHAAADQLDVDPNEFEISGLSCPVTGGQGYDQERFGELAVNDRVPNGAGFTREIYERFPDLLASILDGRNRYAARVLSSSHLGVCDSKCPICLQTFRNMPFHGLLDWRLGLSLMRVLANENYNCGLDGNMDYTDLSSWSRADGAALDWLQWAESLVGHLCRNFAQARFRHFGQLPGYVANDRAVIVRHPLWGATSNLEDNILAAARVAAESDGLNVSLVDTFNLALRPVWVWKSINEL